MQGIPATKLIGPSLAAVVTCIARCATVAVVIVLSGCTHFDMRKNIPWGENDNGEFDAPLKVVTVWTDTVLQQPDQPSVRGFGGRLMFYGKKPNDPVKVSGSLVVYAFDETDREPTNVTPDRKYVFTIDQFKNHYSKSTVGHSYSFWIPWDQAGGEQKDISLIARFTPTKGAVVVSEQTKHLLPGTAPMLSIKGSSGPKPVLGEKNPGVIQQVGHTEAIADEAMRKMQTTTIPINTQFGQRPPIVQTSPMELPSTPQAQPIIFQAAPAPVNPAASASPPTASPSARFGPARHRVLGAPLPRLERGRDPS